MIEKVRADFETPKTPIVLSGCLGPRGDGYIPGERMTTKQAEQYHAVQIETLAGTSVDALSALTMNYVDDDETSGYPLYYMVNCAHTSHFEHVLLAGEPWCDRIRGLRANASAMSHEELNEAPELDAGDPVTLGRDYARLKSGKLRNLNVVGGCCGTDDRHVEQMAFACLPLFQGVPKDAR